MDWLNRISSLVRHVILVSALVLVSAFQHVSAGEGGPGAGPGGGASPQRQTIVVFPGSTSEGILKQLGPIIKNPDIDYKLRVPNVKGSTSAPLVNLIRTAHGYIGESIKFIRMFMNGNIDGARIYIRINIKNRAYYIRQNEGQLGNLHPVRHPNAYAKKLATIARLKSQKRYLEQLLNALAE